MAQSQSAKKRIRQNAVHRLRNRYKGKTARNAIKKLMEIEDKAEATKLLSGTLSMVDKLAKSNVIHANKAGRLKSQLTRHVNGL